MLDLSRQTDQAWVSPRTVQTENYSIGPKDVQELMRYLKLDRYHILGGSGGGPFALVCAKELPPSQIISANVWAGAGPPEMGLRGSRFFSFLCAWQSMYLKISLGFYVQTTYLDIIQFSAMWKVLKKNPINDSSHLQ